MAVCFGEQVLVPRSAPRPPNSQLSFPRDRGARSGDYPPCFSWSQVIHSRPGEKWCAMWEPLLHDFSAAQGGQAWAGVGRCGRGGDLALGSQGRQLLDLEQLHRVYITSHSPRPHPGRPGSSSPSRGEFACCVQGLLFGFPGSQTPPTVPQQPTTRTAHSSACVLGGLPRWLGSPRPGRGTLSDQNTVGGTVQAPN